MIHNVIRVLVVCSAVFLLAGAGPLGCESKAEKTAACVKSATGSSDECKKCCAKAGASGHMWTGEFLGNVASCECL